jgi:TldD protein
MRKTLSGILMGMDVDYADIRYEENRKTIIGYEGKELRRISTSTNSGGHLRAYAEGGKAIASFSSLDDVASLAKKSVAAAKLAGEYRARPLRLADAPVITDSFLLTPCKDPRKISLKEKEALTAHYNQIVLEDPKVVTTHCDYDEFYSHRLFFNKEGTAVEYELLIVNISGLIVVKEGNFVQRVRFGFGGNENFSNLLNREEELKERIHRARELLQAESVKAGVCPVVLDPDEAGVFIHEAFGHLSEADGLQNNPSFREKLQIGTVLGQSLLNVTDDPGLLEYPGGYLVDDEGVKGAKTPLITEGVLTGRLHSRETAAEFEEPLTGNMRAVDAHFMPIVRMSNIFIEPSASTFDDMVASIDNGYYLVGAKGGQTSGDQFSFGAQWGYRIENGRLGLMVRDINMSGELFSTLKAISMIGNDLTFSERGGCGKGGGGPMQLNRKSGKGSPHIKIDAVTIGGVG